MLSAALWAALVGTLGPDRTGDLQWPLGLVFSAAVGGVLGWTGFPTNTAAAAGLFVAYGWLLVWGMTSDDPDVSLTSTLIWLVVGTPIYLATYGLVCVASAGVVAWSRARFNPPV